MHWIPICITSPPIFSLLFSFLNSSFTHSFLLSHSIPRYTLTNTWFILSTDWLTDWCLLQFLCLVMSSLSSFFFFQKQIWHTAPEKVYLVVDSYDYHLHPNDSLLFVCRVSLCFPEINSKNLQNTRCSEWVSNQCRTKIFWNTCVHVCVILKSRFLRIANPTELYYQRIIRYSKKKNINILPRN